MEPTPETSMPTARAAVTSPAPPARPTTSDPRDLTRAPKPMPTRAHTMRRSDGERVTVLLQGLTYLEKNEVDMWSRQELLDDQEKDTTRPNMWQPRMVAKAVRNPNGARTFTEEHEIRAFARALAEQFPDAVIHKAADVVSELSGYGKDAEAEAGKE